LGSNFLGKAWVKSWLSL